MYLKKSNFFNKQSDLTLNSKKTKFHPEQHFSPIGKVVLGCLFFFLMISSSLNGAIVEISNTNPIHSILIQVIEKDKAQKVSKVVVFNDCDASTMETNVEGQVRVWMSEGECCHFTFSREDFREQEMEVCLNKNNAGVLEILYKKEASVAASSEEDLMGKSLNLYNWQSEEVVFKDVSEGLYLHAQNEEAFTGEYKGLLYENGQLIPDERCCYFAPKTNEFVAKSGAPLPVNTKIVSTTLPLDGSPIKVTLEPALVFQFKGRILNAKHIFPMEGAEVILMENNSPAKTLKQTTDLDGTFDFILKKDKCYQMYVRKENYVQKGERIEICTNGLHHSEVFEVNVFLGDK